MNLFCLEVSSDLVHVFLERDWFVLLKHKEHSCFCLGPCSFHMEYPISVVPRTFQEAFFCSQLILPKCSLLHTSMIDLLIGTLLQNKDMVSKKHIYFPSIRNSEADISEVQIEGVNSILKSTNDIPLQKQRTF